MRYIYKCIRCEKDIEEVQGTFNETLRIEGAMCRDCCRTSVNQFYERTMIGMKKLHWTQTPEGKKRMSSIRKKQWKTMRKGKGKRTDEEFEDGSLNVVADERMQDLLRAPRKGLKKRKPRPNAGGLSEDGTLSIRNLLEALFEQAEATQEAARQIADKLGLEL